METLSGIKEYDLDFKEKISINETNFYGKSDFILWNNDVKLIKTYIVGVKEFRQVSWNEKLNHVKAYMDENKKRPSNNDKDKYIKQLGIWIQNQQKNYQKNEYIMKNKYIQDKWKEFRENENYREYFGSNKKRRIN